MYQVRFHGRGGQGVVTAAELLAGAAIADGRFAQAFPSFGSERTGAPVAAYCRIDIKPIRSRDPVSAPDAVVVLDETLAETAAVAEGLKPGAVVIVNAVEAACSAVFPDTRAITLPATRIALEHVGRPLPNAAMIGALAAATAIVTPLGVRAAIAARFAGRTGEANGRAADAAYRHVLGAAAHAADQPALEPHHV
jgi:pyruvate ferredoxin oxidoreductase gamma subunit